VKEQVADSVFGSLAEVIKSKLEASGPTISVMQLNKEAVELAKLTIVGKILLNIPVAGLIEMPEGLITQALAAGMSVAAVDAHRKLWHIHAVLGESNPEFFSALNKALISASWEG